MIDVKNAISSGLVKETADQVKAEILILDDIKQWNRCQPGCDAEIC